MKKLFNKISLLAVLFSVVAILPIFGIALLFSSLFYTGSGFISLGPGFAAFLITILYGIPAILLTTIITLFCWKRKAAFLPVVGYLLIVIGIPILITQIYTLPRHIDSLHASIDDRHFLREAENVINFRRTRHSTLQSAIHYQDGHILYVLNPSHVRSNGIRHHIGYRIPDSALPHYTVIYYNNRLAFHFLVSEQNEETSYAVTIPGKGTFRIHYGATHDLTHEVSRQIKNFGVDAQIARETPNRFIDDEFEIHGFPLQEISLEGNYITIPASVVPHYQLAVFQNDGTINHFATANSIERVTDFFFFLVVENSEPMYFASSPPRYDSTAISLPDASNRIHIPPSPNGNLNLQAYLKIYYAPFSESWGRSVRISNILRFTH